MAALRHIATEPAGLDMKVLDKMDKSPNMKHKTKSQSGVSDSEFSTETNSLSADSNNDNGRSPIKSTPSGFDSHSLKSRQRRRGAEWEIIDSSKNPHYFEQVPSRLDGFLLKKRKWPLKGWHKVSQQILSYYFLVICYVF